MNPTRSAIVRWFMGGRESPSRRGAAIAMSRPVSHPSDSVAVVSNRAAKEPARARSVIGEC